MKTAVDNKSNTTATTKIKITWKAFGDKPEIGRFITSVKIEADEVFSKNIADTLNLIYCDTNLYQGYFWDLLEKNLRSTRTHTALSVGDEVEINGTTYRCAEVGWVVVK